MSTRYFVVLMIAALLSTTAATSLSGAQQYAFTSFENPVDASRETIAQGINALGQVVGGGEILNGDAFLWTPHQANSPTGTMKLLSGANDAVSINAMGQVVGCISICVGSSAGVARLWTPTSPNGQEGTWVDLNGLPLPFATARGINDLGQVVGEQTIRGRQHAFLWSPTVPNGSTGTVVDLGDLPGGTDTSAGWAINNFGQVIGNGNGAGFSGNAMLWTPGVPNGLSGTLHAIAGSSSIGSGINNKGQVVGRTLMNGGFVWTPTTPNGTSGTIAYLGTTPGIRPSAVAINSHGEVVGSSNATGAERAILWTPTVPNGDTGNILDLHSVLSAADAPKWSLVRALGINDFGQIVGWGRYDPDGAGGVASVIRGFLLTPVPEPGTCVLALLATVCCVGALHRQRIAA